MAHNYSALFKLPTTRLRFFTVYGPWGRPDKALFLFARAIIEGQPLKVFNYGHHARDFTYVEDIAEWIVWDRADVVDPRQGRATKATIAFSVSYENRSPRQTEKPREGPLHL